METMHWLKRHPDVRIIEEYDLTFGRPKITMVINEYRASRIIEWDHCDIMYLVLDCLYRDLKAAINK